MVLKNNKAPLLFYFKLVHNFIAIGEFKLELQSGNDQIGAKFILTSVTLTFDPWPWHFAWISLLSMAIIPENFMMIRRKEHCENVSQADRQRDRQTDRSVLRTAWSQLKICERMVRQQYKACGAGLSGCWTEERGGWFVMFLSSDNFFQY